MGPNVKIDLTLSLLVTTLSFAPLGSLCSLVAFIAYNMDPDQTALRAV